MSSNPSKPMIMLVDDFPSTLMVLEKMLKRANYEVTAFSSGQEALDSAGKVKPDLILLDVQMPGMDGYEVCTKLKGTLELADIPVLFLSAADEPMDKVKAFNCGASDYLTKPYHPAEILSRVGIYLEAQRLGRELKKVEAKWDEGRLNELEELMGEFNNILIQSSKSPVAALANCLNTLKSDVQGKLSREEMTSLDGAVTYTAQISQLFQKFLRAMSTQARARKK
ncbi:MAG TPA: response regulator [Verrucomicrobiae bacterium]|nr:response regulator [Verrucomicrobiae bacterium]